VTRVLVAMDRLNSIMTVWASGNNHLSGCKPVTSWCMSTLPTSITAGAVNLALKRQPYSSVGGQCYPLHPGCVAPTEGVVPWGSGFRDYGPQGAGTSACAPQLSAALAILTSVYPQLTNAELRAAIRGSAFRLGPDRDYDPGTGSGLLRIPEALTLGPRAKQDPSLAYERTFLGRVSSAV
jgi:hypothetical protein